MTCENQQGGGQATSDPAQQRSSLCNVPTWIFLVVCVLTIRIQMGG